MPKRNKALHYLPIVIAVFSTLPRSAQAFLSFCFPISFALLFFLTGWPGMIIYELLPGLYKRYSEYALKSTASLLLGLVLDVILAVLLGLIIDKVRRRRGKKDKKFRFIFAAAIASLIAALFLLSLIDPTCA